MVLLSVIVKLQKVLINEHLRLMRIKAWNSNVCIWNVWSMIAADFYKSTLFYINCT